MVSNMAPAARCAVEKSRTYLLEAAHGTSPTIKDHQMKRWVVLLMCVAFTAPAFAKSCEEVKAEIAAKLDAKGVVGYTMEAVPADQPDDRTKIGVCEGGAKKIVYSRGG
jgi:hypothetical protein